MGAQGIQSPGFQSPAFNHRRSIAIESISASAHSSAQAGNRADLARLPWPKRVGRPTQVDASSRLLRQCLRERRLGKIGEPSKSVERPTPAI